MSDITLSICLKLWSSNFQIFNSISVESPTLQTLSASERRIIKLRSRPVIPLTTLYDDYNGRPKLTEQKNPFKYIDLPPPPTPLKWFGTKRVFKASIKENSFKKISMASLLIDLSMRFAKVRDYFFRKLAMDLK